MIKHLKRFYADSKVLMSAPACDKSVKRIALIFSTVALLGASIGIPFTADIVYYGILLVSLMLLMYKGGFKLSAPFIALYIIIFLNIAITDIPPLFKPVQRTILFILLTMVCTSAMDTNIAVKFRAYLFRYTVFGLIIIGVGSFFCFFAGINMMASRADMMSDFEKYSSTGGWFSGLATHSMMLGPIAMISALAFYFLYQKKTDKIYLLLFFASAMSAVFAASRAALLGLVIAIVYNLVTGKVNAVIRKRMIGILTLSAILSIPIAGIAFKGVLNKQAARESQSEGLNSRQDKFDYRIAEFKSSPILGVGFCAIDTTGGDRFDNRDGRIEPGTSHLSVLSMLGISGFAVYLVILYKAYANTKKMHTLHSRFVFTCFIAFFVHAWFEGYIFAAGGFLAYLYWLIIGQCIDCSRAYKMITKRDKKDVIVPRIGNTEVTGSHFP